MYVIVLIFMIKYVYVSWRNYILRKEISNMKTYQKPELILQSINVADVLTTSFIADAGDAVEISWDSLF